MTKLQESSENDNTNRIIIDQMQENNVCFIIQQHLMLQSKISPFKQSCAEQIDKKLGIISFDIGSNFAVYTFHHLLQFS